VAVTSECLEASKALGKLATKMSKQSKQSSGEPGGMAEADLKQVGVAAG
jgi:hypothetical protein